MAFGTPVALMKSTPGFTPLSTAFGGENIEANKMRLFAKWVEKKEVRKTPWTDFMKRRGSPYNQPVIETGQSYAPFITTTLTGATTNNSNILTLGSTAFLREGDILKVTPYYDVGQTELNYNLSELDTVLTITDATHAVTLRTQGKYSSGSWPVQPIGSEVRVISRAQNYNEPFPDAISWRGDTIDQYVQRFDSGELVYDIAATHTGDYEADNHMLVDIMNWKDILPKYREAAFIQGRRVAPDYDANPQIPGHLGGAIWWAEQGVDTVYQIDGQINPFSFDDILRDKAENHSDGPGDTMFGGYKTIAAIDTGLNELKGNFGPNETTFTSKVTKLSYRWGDITPRPVHDWPEGVILITSKSDWEWTNYEGMDWQYVERGPEELGAFQRSWTMGGDFSMTCLNVSRQILMTGIDTRLDLYPGRQVFMGGVGV
jgi:hypothetical protein